MNSHVWQPVYHQLTHGWDDPFDPEDWFDFIRSQAAAGLAVAPRTGRKETLIRNEILDFFERGKIDLPLVHLLLVLLCREAGIPVGRGVGSQSASHLLHALGVTRADPDDYAILPEFYLLFSCRGNRVDIDLPHGCLDEVRKLAAESGLAATFRLAWPNAGIEGLGERRGDEITVWLTCMEDWDDPVDFSAIPYEPRTPDELALHLGLIHSDYQRAYALPNYLERRSGDEPPSPPHPALEDILAHSLGLPFTREDLLLSIRRLAGYSLRDAVEIRRILIRSPLTRSDVLLSDPYFPGYPNHVEQRTSPPPEPEEFGRAPIGKLRRDIRECTGVCEDEAEALVALLKRWAGTGWAHAHFAAIASGYVARTPLAPS